MAAPAQELEELEEVQALVDEYVWRSVNVGAPFWCKHPIYKSVLAKSEAEYEHICSITPLSFPPGMLAVLSFPTRLLLWNRLSVQCRRNVKIFLRRRGVYTGKNTAGLSYSLYNISNIEEPLEWEKLELHKVQFTENTVMSNRGPTELKGQLNRGFDRQKKTKMVDNPYSRRYNASNPYSQNKTKKIHQNVRYQTCYTNTCLVRLSFARNLIGLTIQRS